MTDLVFRQRLSIAHSGGGGGGDAGLEMAGSSGAERAERRMEGQGELPSRSQSGLTEKI
jgi:hypothetical protein